MFRLFALDHNFPDPIVAVLAEFQSGAELVRVDEIDARMPDLDDWQLLLALHHHERPWDGLITNDDSMLNLGSELAVLCQTKLTLVVARAAGHDPVKAAGLLFAYLGGICKRSEPGKGQVWRLNAVERAADDPWEFVRRFADHNNRTTGDGDEFRLSPEQLAQDPLAHQTGRSPD